MTSKMSSSGYGGFSSSSSISRTAQSLLPGATGRTARSRSDLITTSVAVVPSGNSNSKSAANPVRRNDNLQAAPLGRSRSRANNTSSSVQSTDRNIRRQLRLRSTPKELSNAPSSATATGRAAGGGGTSTLPPPAFSFLPELVSERGRRRVKEFVYAYHNVGPAMKARLDQLNAQLKPFGYNLLQWQSRAGAAASVFAPWELSPV